MRRLALLVGVLMTAGCADSAPDIGAPSPANSSPSPQTSSPSGDLSSPSPPTLAPPTAPPKSPSDPRPPKDLLVGRVTRGGTGPCYGLETDDGKQYALYSDAGMSLEVGTTIRVRTAPLLLKIDCGPGEHLSAVKITRVG